MQIALLGASSRIAGDFISLALNDSDLQMDLYARKTQLNLKALNKKNCKNLVGNYKEFINTKTKYDAVINFIGLGNPEIIQSVGSKIIETNYKFDSIAIKYLKKNPDCQYIFFSSGAVFGSKFEEPVSDDTQSIFPINQLGNQNWYGISKFYTEIRHRMLKDLPIVDIRVFNYFSNSYNIEDRSLITDILRSIRDNNKFQTSSENIVRDYIGPNEVFQLIKKILITKHQNIAVDCFSKSPVDKFTLLKEFNSRFSLQYELINNNTGILSTGDKLKYYSNSRKASKIFGYQPTQTSLNIIIEQYKRRNLII
jgi:nucleoside-diphosphate-sugar epimerase